MDPDMFFGIFTPVIIFNVAFDMDIYMLQKLFWQVIVLLLYYTNHVNYVRFIIFYPKIENKEDGEIIVHQSGESRKKQTNCLRVLLL